MIFFDFEASGVAGFPAEAGFCKVEADRSMHQAAKLIYHPLWLDQVERWDDQAERLHGISRADLVRSGESPAMVMNWLNRELNGTIALVDSQLDKKWLRELADAAGVEPTFHLEDIAWAFSGPEVAREADSLEADLICRAIHRAGPDAEHMAVRYLMSLYVGAPVHRLFKAGTGFDRRPLN